MANKNKESTALRRDANDEMSDEQRALANLIRMGHIWLVWSGHKSSWALVGPAISTMITLAVERVEALPDGRTNRETVFGRLADEIHWTKFTEIHR